MYISCVGMCVVSNKAGYVIYVHMMYKAYLKTKYKNISSSPANTYQLTTSIQQPTISELSKYFRNHNSLNLKKKLRNPLNTIE